MRLAAAVQARPAGRRGLLLARRVRDRRILRAVWRMAGAKRRLASVSHSSSCNGSHCGRELITRSRRQSARRNCHSGPPRQPPDEDSIERMNLSPRLRGRVVEVAGIEPAEPPVFMGLRRYSPAFSGHACPGRATMDQWMPRICTRVPAASAREPRPRPRPARCRRSAGGRRGRCARTPKTRDTQSWRTTLGETSSGSTSLNTSDLNTSDRRSTRARTTSDRLMPADCVCPPRVRSKCDGPTHHRLGPRRSVHHRPRHHQATRAGEKTTKVLGRPGTKTT